MNDQQVQVTENNEHLGMIVSGVDQEVKNISLEHLEHGCLGSRPLGLPVEQSSDLDSCLGLQTTPGPGATVQKSTDSLAVPYPILAGWCNASVLELLYCPQGARP